MVEIVVGGPEGNFVEENPVICIIKGIQEKCLSVY